MKPEDDFDTLVDALRNDWPSEEKTAQMRARLASLGIVTATTLTASGAAASALTAKGVSAGLAAEAVSRFAALSWGAKIGLATVVSVGAIGTPVLLSSRPEPEPAPALRRASSARAPVSPAVKAVAPMPVERTAEPVEPALIAPPTSTGGRAAPSRMPAAAAPAPPASGEALPHVASFESVETSTTLREETALLDAALAALRAADGASAERFVREHERRFPNGLLQKERERARARILGIDRTREKTP